MRTGVPPFSLINRECHDNLGRFWVLTGAAGNWISVRPHPIWLILSPNAKSHEGANGLCWIDDPFKQSILFAFGNFGTPNFRILSCNRRWPPKKIACIDNT